MFRKLSEVISLRAEASSCQQRAYAQSHCILQTMSLVKSTLATKRPNLRALGESQR